MPYISQEDRRYIDDTLEEYADAPVAGPEFGINDIVEVLKDVPSGKVKGAVNYFIHRLVLGAMKPESGWSYSSLSETIAVLRDAADEIQRRLMAPYENNAILMNGDLPEYNEGLR